MSIPAPEGVAAIVKLRLRRAAGAMHHHTHQGKTTVLDMQKDILRDFDLFLFPQAVITNDPSGPAVWRGRGAASLSSGGF